LGMAVPGKAKADQLKEPLACKQAAAPALR